MTCGQHKEACSCDWLRGGGAALCMHILKFLGSVHLFISRIVAMGCGDFWAWMVMHFMHGYSSACMAWDARKVVGIRQANDGPGEGVRPSFERAGAAQLSVGYKHLYSILVSVVARGNWEVFLWG